MNKRGQFFILSAVIISVIIVSMISVKNFVSVGDAPKKFYYYSDQLKDETGAVVDWALYNGQDATNIGDFVQQGISKTMGGYPTMEIVACWTDTSNTKWLKCQNNGTKYVTINTSKEKKILSGSVEKYTEKGTMYSSINSLSINKEKFMTITPNGSISYTISLKNSSIQTGQFYFIFKVDTPSGEYVSDSTTSRPLSAPNSDMDEFFTDS